MPEEEGDKTIIDKMIEEAVNSHTRIIIMTTEAISNNMLLNIKSNQSLVY